MKDLIWGVPSWVFIALLGLISKQTSKNLHDSLALPSSWMGCGAVGVLCVSLGHSSPTKVEQTETAQPEAAAV